MTDAEDTISTAKDILLQEINGDNGEFSGEDIDVSSITFVGETHFVGIILDTVSDDTEDAAYSCIFILSYISRQFLLGEEVYKNAYDTGR